MRILELNDRGIRLIDEAGEVYVSPGFAQDDGESLVIGAAAEQVCKLNPTSSYDKFWHQLSLEPLVNSTVRIRHNADIAYAQLQHLAESLGNELEADPKVLVAVPANFSRDQLSILLGLLKATAFEVLALVDSALLGSVQHVEGGEGFVHADIQLHQVVLSSLKRVGGELKLDSVVQIPGVGLQNFYDLIMQLAKELFVQQCRFNPQHNAESEQQLYDAIPLWLSQEMEDGTLTLELNTGDSVHLAKMPRAAMLIHLQSFYQKIGEQIQALVSDSSTMLLLSQQLADLPEFLASLAGEGTAGAGGFTYRVLAEDAILRSTHALNSHFAEQPQAGRLLGSLPVLMSEAEGEQDAQESQDPTHALFENKAFSVGTIKLGNGRVDNAWSGRFISFNENSADETLGTIQREEEQAFLLSDGKLTLNQRAIVGRQRLVLGDRIGTRDVSEHIHMIAVATSG